MQTRRFCRLARSRGLEGCLFAAFLLLRIILSINQITRVGGMSVRCLSASSYHSVDYPGHEGWRDVCSLPFCFFVSFCRLGSRGLEGCLFAAFLLLRIILSITQVMRVGGVSVRCLSASSYHSVDYPDQEGWRGVCSLPFCFFVSFCR